MSNSVETKASSVELAIEQALEQLCATREQVEIEVLSKGSFFAKAQVRVTLNDTIAMKIEKFVNGILLHMGLKSRAVVEDIDKTLFITIEGEDSGVAIGYRGETLDAFQYLTLTYLNQEKCEFRKVIVDCENYRQKRSETLTTLAFRLAEKAQRTCRKVALEPMNPFERRIIHSALAECEIADTISEGEEPNRYVVIIPKGVEIREDRSDNFRRNDGRGGNGRDNRNRDNRPNDNRNREPRFANNGNRESRPERSDNSAPIFENKDNLATANGAYEYNTNLSKFDRSEVAAKVENRDNRESRPERRDNGAPIFESKDNLATGSGAYEYNTNVDKFDRSEVVAKVESNSHLTDDLTSNNSEKTERRERFGLPDRTHEDRDSSFERRGNFGNRENSNNRGSSYNRENSNNRENSFNRRDNNFGDRNFGDRERAPRPVEVEAEDGREFRGYFTEPTNFEKPEVKKTGAPKFKSFGGPKKF